SGGPLLDTDGNMVGVNTMIARQAADGLAITAVNFSLKSSVAVTWLAGAAGMGLAYAPKGAEQMTVAMAPAPQEAPARTPQGQVQESPPAAVKEPQISKDPPENTIVVAEV